MVQVFQIPSEGEHGKERFTLVTIVTLAEGGGGKDHIVLDLSMDQAVACARMYPQEYILASKMVNVGKHHDERRWILIYLRYDSDSYPHRAGSLDI